MSVRVKSSRRASVFLTSSLVSCQEPPAMQPSAQASEASFTDSTLSSHTNWVRRRKQSPRTLRPARSWRETPRGAGRIRDAKITRLPQRDYHSRHVRTANQPTMARMSLSRARAPSAENRWRRRLVSIRFERKSAEATSKARVLLELRTPSPVSGSRRSSTQLSSLKGSVKRAARVSMF